MKKNTITKTLTAGKNFSTKNDAFRFITGKEMKNNMIVGEADTYNVVFLQRGEAHYTNRDGEKVLTGLNRIYDDRITSLVPESLKAPMRDTSKPMLVFEKYNIRGNKGLTYYRFLGEFKATLLQSVAGGNMNYGEYVKVSNDVVIK